MHMRHRCKGERSPYFDGVPSLLKMKYNTEQASDIKIVERDSHSIMRINSEIVFLRFFVTNSK